MSSTRALYRNLLRELPPLTPKPTSLHARLRQRFNRSADMPKEHAEQFLKYLQCQRVYVTLLERYNPGLAGDLDVEEHTRLTARRVGLNMPKTFKVGDEKK
ncbi:ras guanyl-nucleotide exchange factor [Tricharina praecox]|uniref:ras guanyl-nucleotide exchange factor n=1 Tax=Tricharina praecox TaxID=43433 RepID=UPI00221E45F5|nr:ras guanyl-nucleotide exchange factor [Tricharina praecox]KAI5859196.1 ras guanyl-nucleotide exchange factor [Tricharina praecox]